MKGHQRGRRRAVGPGGRAAARHLYHRRPVSFRLRRSPLSEQGTENTDEVGRRRSPETNMAQLQDKSLLFFDSERVAAR